MRNPDTEALLDMAQKGDPSACDQLLARHRERLRRMVAIYLDSRLSARIDPSDVLQEALACAAVRLPEYLDSRPVPFYPWLRAMVREALVDAHRRHVQAQRRSVAREIHLEASVSDASAMKLADRLAAVQSSPSEQLNLRELTARIKQGMNSLEREDRELVLMRCVEQMSIAEITEVLAISQTAAKSRIRRALQKLVRFVELES